MDFRSIVLYLRRKLPSARNVHGNVVNTLGPDAVNYATVTRWLREVAFISAVEEPSESPPTKDRDEVDDTILLVFAEQPFASMRNLSQLTHISRNSVHWGLTTSLGSTVRHLRSVPPVVSDAQKRTRAHISGELQQLLQVQEIRVWHDIMTLGES
jgi:hypothetical protein